MLLPRPTKELLAYARNTLGPAGSDPSRVGGGSASGIRPAVANVLLAAAAASSTIALVSTIAWWQASRPRRVSLEDLGPDERQALVEELFQVSPDVLVSAWYAPAIGYTLRPGSRIEAWGDTFTSNELGYRTGPVRKEPGVLRVVFVGDSWTYGMGVEEEQSFPAQFEELARGTGGRRIEAWSLALPGYNLVNEIAALEGFFERIEPDAVVLCPHPNDVDTDLHVAPNGSWKRRSSVAPAEGFGSDIAVKYPQLPISSHRFQAAWRNAFERIGRTESWLAQHRVPLLLFFVASWNEPFVHHLVQQGELRSPYAIAPAALALPPYQGPPPYSHGNAECYRRYARIVHRGLETPLQLSPLPVETGELEVAIHPHPPPGDWAAETNQQMTAWTGWSIPASYEPAPGARGCVGAMDCATGRFGGATTVLLRRERGAGAVTLRLERIPGAESLYPLDFTVSIPSASGPNTSAHVLPAGDGPVEVSVPIPADLGEEVAMDVEIRASRESIAPELLVPRSMIVAGIVQAP